MELSELINSIDIVEYISQFIDLEQRGDEFWGLSCFKEEQTPSFSVRRDPPKWYDFSSGKGGNLFSFVMQYHDCPKGKAVQILKEYAGIDGDVPVTGNKMAATVDCRRFMPPKREQKASSGVILDENYMQRYENRPEKLDAWRREGISDLSMARFQVKYDSFSNRIVYPIRNVDGQIVNVGGRTLDPQWKEKKLRKYTYFFGWGTMQTIYGLAENRKYIEESGEVIIFEGCKSVLLADSWGIHNCGAILTSHVNPNQMKILAALGCHVVFALDKDVDIHADKNIRKLSNYVNCEYIFDAENLLNEKDSPVDQGQEVFEQLYKSKRKVRY